MSFDLLILTYNYPEITINLHINWIYFHLFCSANRRKLYSTFFQSTYLSISTFVQTDSERYAGYVFDTFDQDSHGRVSFRSFLLGMSVLSRGNTDEKLRWIFNLYDIDKNGYITQV